jgi:hypothetical protein
MPSKDDRILVNKLSNCGYQPLPRVNPEEKPNPPVMAKMDKYIRFPPLKNSSEKDLIRQRLGNVLDYSKNEMLKRIDTLEEKLDKILSILNKNELKSEMITLCKQNNLPIF